MKTSEDLKQILERIDHRGYPAYKDTRGAYQFGTYILGIDHVQVISLKTSFSVLIMYREIRLRHRPGCIYRWQEERPGFREIYMTANVKRWLWQIICCGILQSNWNGTRFRHMVPEKAGSSR